MFRTFFPRASRDPADTQKLARIFIENNNPNDVTPPDSYKGRVEVQKSTGSVSLKISSVTLNDDNQYLCTIIHLSGSVTGPAINLEVEGELNHDHRSNRRHLKHRDAAAEKGRVSLPTEPARF